MNRIRILLTFTLIFSFLCGINLFSQDAGKMPVTSNSEKAKEEFLKGRDLYERLRVQESLDHFNSAVREDPEFALAYLYRAQAQNSGKDFTSDLNKAVSFVHKASEGEKLYIEGFQAGIAGNSDKQKELYERVASMFPNDERVHTFVANYYAGIPDHDKEIEHLNKAIQINPEYSPAYNSLGYAYKNSGKLDEAEKTFQKYIGVLPGDPNPYDSYAELLLKQGKFDEAITNYKKALNLDEYFNSSKTGIAAAYIYQGKFDDARDQIRDLFETAKNNGQRESALRLMAVSYVEEGNLEDALVQYDKEQKIASSYSDYSDMSNIHFRKGNLLYEMGKYDEAKEEFQASLDDFNKSDVTEDSKDNYKNTIALNTSMVSLKQQGNQMAAARTDMDMPVVSDTDIKNDAQKNQAARLKIISAIDKNDGDGALNSLKDINQNDPYNMYLMGKAYMLKGDSENARNYFNKVITLNELPTLNSALARHHARQELKNLK